MSDHHRIRLQSAWETSADGRAWMRSFGRPTGVGADDRVWLVIEHAAPCTVTLNGRALPAWGGGAATWRHDVTADLRNRNALRLEFGARAGGAPLAERRLPLPEECGAVTLEIESRG